MKIAFLNLYSGINNRGAESFMHELAARLSKANTVDFYYGGKAEGSETYNVKSKSITNVTQPTHTGGNLLKRLFLDKPSREVLRFSLATCKELWNGSYDVIIPINGFWQLLLAKVVSIFRGSKVVVVGNAGPFWDERFNLYLKPDVFVATTGPTAAWAKKVAPWTKIATIPYAIDEGLFTKAPTKKLNLEHPVVLCVAAATPYKRVEQAIKAVATLPKGSLVHLGTGVLQKEIDELGDKLLGKKRFLSQSVTYTEVPSYYKAADVVTVPSTSQENSPMAFLEAIAAGKRVVVEDYPRARWLLGEAGIYTSIADTQKYGQQLEVNATPLEASVAKRELTRFTWDTILDSYTKLLSSLK